MVSSSIRKKALKMGGIMYHLYHQEASRTNEQYHVEVLQQVKLHQQNGARMALPQEWLIANIKEMVIM